MLVYFWTQKSIGIIEKHLIIRNFVVFPTKANFPGNVENNLEITNKQTTYADCQSRIYMLIICFVYTCYEL